MLQCNSYIVNRTRCKPQLLRKLAIGKAMSESRTKLLGNFRRNIMSWF